MLQQEFYCTSCKEKTNKPKMQGSVWIELLLWSIYIIPGLAYSIWRRKYKAKICPNCEKTTLELYKNQ